MVENAINDFSDYSESFLETMIEGAEDALESRGGAVNESALYKTDKETFAFIDSTIEGVHRLQYYTVKNHNAINVAMNIYSDNGTDHESIMKSVVDSVKFGDIYATAEKDYEPGELSVIVGSENSGVRFALPSGWDIYDGTDVDLNTEDESEIDYYTYIDKNGTGLYLLFGEHYIWDDTSEIEKLLGGSKMFNGVEAIKNIDYLGEKFQIESESVKKYGKFEFAIYQFSATLDNFGSAPITVFAACRMVNGWYTMLIEYDLLGVDPDGLLLKAALETFSYDEKSMPIVTTENANDTENTEKANTEAPSSDETINSAPKNVSPNIDRQNNKNVGESILLAGLRGAISGVVIGGIGAAVVALRKRKKKKGEEKDNTNNTENIDSAQYNFTEETSPLNTYQEGAANNVFCPRCGKKVGGSEAFCPFCGERI